MLLSLGLSTMFATLQTIITCCSDAFPKVSLTVLILACSPVTKIFQTIRKHQMVFTGVLCVILFIAGLPMVTNGGIYILTLFDDFAGTYGKLKAVLSLSLTKHFVKHF